MSSEYVSDWQVPVRTIRADGIRFHPSGKRIYEKFGNAIAVYDTARFLARLYGQEPLVPVSQLPASSAPPNRSGDPLERYLQVDRYFYAEDLFSGWTCPPMDGQERLYDWDIDDRGYVYLAYSLFGWGIARDDSGVGLLPSWQDHVSLNWVPTRVMWVKDGNAYYAFVGRWITDSTHVYLVPDTPGTPEEQTPFPKGIVKSARAGATRVAIIEEATNGLLIYDVHSMVTNGPPVQSFVPPGSSGTFSDVVWDGTRFWACSYSSGLVGYLSSFTPDVSGQTYTRQDFPLANGQLFQPLNMQAGSGYLAITASDSTGRGLHLYKITTGTPAEIPVTSISQYYQPPGGYAQPPHTQIYSAVPLVLTGSAYLAGNVYLIVSAHGLGDVYQIRSDTPNNVVATATTSTSVLVTWTPIFDATLYDVFRSANGSNFQFLQSVASSSFTDSSAQSNTAYLYAVRVSAPYVSDLSAPDLATTVIFTDDPLVGGSTPVKAVHITELRTAVTAVQTLAGQTPATFTDPAITPGVTTAKTAHVTELRSALDAARIALSFPAAAYTNTLLSAGGSVISAADITDLRNGVK